MNGWIGLSDFAHFFVKRGGFNLRVTPGGVRILKFLTKETAAIAPSMVPAAIRRNGLNSFVLRHFADLHSPCFASILGLDAPSVDRFVSNMG
jgi:hypothetical protein